MKNRFLLFIAALLSLSGCGSSELKLIQNENSIYRIVVPGNPDNLELKAAGELQKYLAEISGVELEVVRENETLTGYKIYVGNTAPGKLSNIRKDEILIKTQAEDVVIAGGDPKSTLYAVYTFLENFLDCRFYSPQAEVIPKSESVAIPGNTDYRYLPPVTTRTVHSRLYYENHEFADKRKSTYKAFPRYVPSAGVHTFHRFVPADKYLKSNPEYFALRNGRRIPTQLCLTNENVLKIVVGQVDSLLKEYPDADVISVSQDDNTQYCQCDNCKAIDDREGSPSGSVIEFVNQVAREFPDKMISTLAYQYTRTAPRRIKPEKNVLITLCSIECDRSAPIDEKCTDFAKDLTDWGKLTDNIRIWDYTTQFTNFLAPFPNIHTIKSNIELFRNNNAKWIFEQHSHHPSELFELRSYLTAKLLWDPDIDQDSIISDFLHGYYEEAAPYIHNYITTVHDEIKKESDFFLFLYGDPSQGFKSFLRPELLKQYDQWYEEAEKAIAGKPEVLKRVRRARISIDYAILEAARINDPESFAMVSANDKGERQISEDLKTRLSRFQETCEEGNITLMNEMRYSVEEYLSAYENTLSRAMGENTAVGSNVKLLQAPKKYAGEDPQTLTDGAFGGANFYANWLGFEGNDLECIIELNNESEINHISSDYLQVVNHIVFFPTDVTYYYSIDGISYSLLGKTNNKRPLSKKSKINDIQSFALDFSPVTARYVKVVANSMKTAPDWHHGAGLPCWIFVDEVIIR
ncbi:MAG: DUF4838 domain-containing protein [Cytophagales bacterium]|nr:DUF4838 domain-containing protein [Cytophagales bacterium]